MVNLSLCSSKGNHVRYFPYNGYLGLTALKVDGVVRTRLDGDLKLLPAHSITVSVRCYEARVGLLGVLTSNCLVDYTQILWSQTDPDETIGDLELPFRITIPPNVAGFSTASYASVYKCSWRVEAIVNHPPMLGVGSRLIKHSELPLVRFDVPRLFSLSTSKTPPDPALSEDIISHPHLPPIRYAVDSPNSAIGPLDLLTLSIQLLPSAPVTFRSASLIVERRLSMKELSRGATASPNASPIVPTSHPSWSLPIPQRTTSSSSPSPASSYQETSSPLSSTVTLQPPDSRSTASLLVNSIAAAESSGHFSLSDSGVWRQTLTLQWPAAKSHSRWSIGESIESDLVSVRFFARLKLVVSSSHGTESVELKERELLVVSTNEAERQLALSKYDELRYSEGGRSKSKSPRRLPRQNDTAPPLPASASRAEYPHRVSASTSHSPSPSSFKPPRRPHTSAGPRDKLRSRPIDKDPPADNLFHQRPPKSGSNGGSGPLTVTTSISAGSASSTSLNTATSSSSLDSNQSEEIREWEEELAKIELRSRRSSDLLAMARTRRLEAPA